MPTIIAYDCKCGEKLSVYMPKVRMVFDSNKKHIEPAEEWDRDDIASGAVKEAEQAAIDAGRTFVHAGTIEAYRCRCGKVISLMDFMHRWLKNIMDKGSKYALRRR